MNLKEFDDIMKEVKNNPGTIIQITEYIFKFWLDTSLSKRRFKDKFAITDDAMSVWSDKYEEFLYYHFYREQKGNEFKYFASLKQLETK